ncbi:MAG: hypothetical protein R3C03_18730 [Pirellulaceae bacterium]
MLKSWITNSLCFVLSLSLTSYCSADDQDLVNEFLKRLESTQVAEPLQQEIRQLWNAADGDASLFMSDALLKLYPDFATGIEAADNDEIDAAERILAPLSTSDDPYLAADASFYLARTLMNNERFEQALPYLNRLTSELNNYSAQPGVIQFYLGQAQAGMLDNSAAVESMLNFLNNFPDAPERLRVSAWRQVQDLRQITEGQLQDVHQHMEFSRRRLGIEEPGDSTQTEQKQIVDMLAKLIKEQEKKECSSGKSNNPKPQQQQDQQQQAQNKPNESKSQSGGQSNNPNGKYVEKSYDTGDASPWSRLRDMDRNAANAGANDKLPARYREIVERYNDAVNGNGGK